MQWERNHEGRQSPTRATSEGMLRIDSGKVFQAKKLRDDRVCGPLGR